MNLFTYENIYDGRVARSATYGVGEIVTRNGIQAYRIAASPYWSGDYATSANIAKGQFIPNTQYIFDMWIDADDIYYSGVSGNVPGGITIRYTDGTSDVATCTGDINNPKGFQHVIVYSNASKSISGLGVYYYISTPAFYRLDSIVAAPKSIQFNKNGIVDVNNISTYYTTTTLTKSGLLGLGNITEN